MALLMGALIQTYPAYVLNTFAM